MLEYIANDTYKVESVQTAGYLFKASKCDWDYTPSCDNITTLTHSTDWHTKGAEQTSAKSNTLSW